MDDIPVGAEIGRKEFTRVLQIRNAQLHRLACECHPRALPQQLDDATGDSGCQFQYVVDRDGVAGYVRRFNSPLCKELRNEAT
jgi:hypothetical protein